MSRLCWPAGFGISAGRRSRAIPATGSPPVSVRRSNSDACFLGSPSFGAGIAAAFAAHGPLSRWPPCAGAALFGTLAFVLRHRLAALAAMLALAALFGGFLAAVLRMQAVEAPVLDRMTIGKV